MPVIPCVIQFLQCDLIQFYPFLIISVLKERAFNWNYQDVKASKTKTMKLAAKLIEPFVPWLPMRKDLSSDISDISTL